MTTSIPSAGEDIRERRPFFFSRPRLAICILLAMLTAGVYAQTWRFSFIAFDDDAYVTDNPRVLAGLSLEGLAWSFSFEEKNKTYWHPLTWLAHMADVSLFGLDPAGHHLVNAALHLASSLLLFFVLTRFTGALWLSGFVAALFAVHPINAESVAWVAERKNVLSTAFWMLTLVCYAQYTQKPSRHRYAILILAFTLGLLAKPMLVTLPFVLLLLDLWPLGRLKPAFKPVDSIQPYAKPPGEAATLRLWDLIKEKIPLLALAALTAYLANDSLKFSGNVISFERIPLEFRLSNMLVSYLTYIAKVIWPTDLAVFYPYPQSIPAWQVSIAVVALGGVSAAAFLNLKQRPYILVGWLWFLVTLVPVSGVIQAGLWPAWADRWAYIPSIGLFVIMAWGLSDLIRHRRAKVIPYVGALGMTVLLVLSVAAHRQVGLWKSDFPLFQNAVEKVEDNFLAYHNLGSLLFKSGRMEDAFALLHQAARISPEYCFPYYTMALQQLFQNQPERAEEYLKKAIALDPRLSVHQRSGADSIPEPRSFQNTLLDFRIVRGTAYSTKIIHNNLGVVYMLLGRTPEAIDAFHAALEIDPGFVEVLNNVGFAYLKTGRLPEAADHLERALAIEPENPAVQKNLKDLSLATRVN